MWLRLFSHQTALGLLKTPFVGSAELRISGCSSLRALATFGKVDLCFLSLYLTHILFYFITSPHSVQVATAAFGGNSILFVPLSISFLIVFHQFFIPSVFFSTQEWQPFLPNHPADDGAPQGCVLGPLLFTLLTCDCTNRQHELHHDVSR